MSLLPAYRAGGPGPWGWSPAAIGSLCAWWDASRSDLVTQSGGLVSAWADSVAGFSLTQATGATKPTYNATGFNGGPVLTFDGVDDCVLSAGFGPLPSNTSVGEVWVLADQTALVADTGQRAAFAYGANATLARTMSRAVSSGANRARAGSHDGTNPTTATETTGDFSGRHVVRGIWAATSLGAEIDGALGSTAVTGHNTSTNTRTRIGASALTGGGSLFWQGGVSMVLAFNTLLSVGEAASLYTYLNRRL
jgi:hypothetical protein